jgi:hypothetical protein
MDKNSTQISHLSLLKTEYAKKVSDHENLVQDTQKNIWQHEIEIEFIKQAVNDAADHEAVVKKWNKLNAGLENLKSKQHEYSTKDMSEEKKMIQILTTLIANMQPEIDDDEQTASAFQTW